MSQTKMVVQVVGEGEWAGWETLEDVGNLFSESEIVTMCQRYQAAQKYAVAYRERSKARQKLMAEKLAAYELAEKAASAKA